MCRVHGEKRRNGSYKSSSECSRCRQEQETISHRRHTLTGGGWGIPEGDASEIPQPVRTEEYIDTSTREFHEFIAPYVREGNTFAGCIQLGDSWYARIQPRVGNMRNVRIPTGLGVRLSPVASGFTGGVDTGIRERVARDIINSGRIAPREGVGRTREGDGYFSSVRLTGGATATFTGLAQTDDGSYTTNN